VVELAADDRGPLLSISVVCVLVKSLPSHDKMLASSLGFTRAEPGHSVTECRDQAREHRHHEHSNDRLANWDEIEYASATSSPKGLCGMA
jgi:hypothetical protein